MNSSALSGAILVVLAALLGFLVLRGVTDRQEVPISVTTPLVTVTPTVEAGDGTTGDDATGDTTTENDGTTPLPTPPAVDTSTARPNDQVSVLVANGTEISGQAGRLTDVLRNKGFNTRQAKNADPFSTSIIYYRPGFEVEASLVQAELNSPTTRTDAMPVPDPPVGDGIDLGPVDVFVLIGADSLSTS